MSVTAELMKMRQTMLRETGKAPAELKVGRAMLDAMADEFPRLMRKGMEPQQWREYVADEARAGTMMFNGIRVELCEVTA